MGLVLSRSRRRVGALRATALLLALSAAEAAAQSRDLPATAGDTLRLSMADAVQIAVDRNPALRLSRLEVERAEAEVREAGAGRLPQVGSTTSFTRDIVSANPFAGTRAGGQFGGQAPTGWLFHNERARTDGNPATRPIPLPEFRQRQEAAFQGAGVGADGEAGGGNPFSVPNQFQTGLSLQQALWDPGVGAQVRSARAARDAGAAGSRWQLAVTVDSTRQAYLAALLARERAEVFSRSVARTRVSVEEAARRVEAGVAPVFERLSAEVELGNLRTELIDAETQEQLARNRLKVTLGLPATQPLALTDPLRVDDGFVLAELPLEAALTRAMERRADLVEARLAIAAQQARVSAARASYRPTLAAFADLSYFGNVPDDRSRVVTDPLRPFEVEEERRSVFASDFWDFGASLGLRVQWNVFNGGALRAQAQQAQVGVRQARVRMQQLENVVGLEVQNAHSELRAARERARLQEENVRLAERNYDLVRSRVVQGVSTPLERREASEQLDRSRLNLLQAVHDYLAARSRLLTAAGSVSAADWETGP